MIVRGGLVEVMGWEKDEKGCVHVLPEHITYMCRITVVILKIKRKKETKNQGHIYIFYEYDMYLSCS